MKRPPAAPIVGGAGLFVSVAGTGAAAMHDPITSTNQITAERPRGTACSARARGSDRIVQPA
jgi:hypothetical protein